MARTDTITVNDSEMRIYLGLPEGPGPFPSIILMCHIGGLDAFTEDRIDRLAAAGYAAAAPDIFHYHDWFEDRNERRASLRDDAIIDDINATLAHLDASAETDPARTAIMGHCMGGRTSMLGAGRISRFNALITYYGGRTMLPWGGDGPTPFETIGNINGPILGFFGDLDAEPAPADVDKIEAEMRRHGKDVVFHRYAEAGHAFQDHTSAARYHQPSADDAWEKTLAFLEKTYG